MDVDDMRLFQVLQYLRLNENSNKGVVGAGIFFSSVDMPPLFATSQKTSSGNWKHAESIVLDKVIIRVNDETDSIYTEKSISQSYVTFVTTLSPCYKDSKNRVGESCSNRLEKYITDWINEIYIGVYDINQPIRSIERLPTFFTENDDLQMICYNLANYFEEKDTSLFEKTTPQYVKESTKTLGLSFRKVR